MALALHFSSLGKSVLAVHRKWTVIMEVLKRNILMVLAILGLSLSTQIVGKVCNPTAFVALADHGPAVVDVRPTKEPIISLETYAGKHDLVVKRSTENEAQEAYDFIIRQRRISDGAKETKPDVAGSLDNDFVQFKEVYGGDGGELLLLRDGKGKLVGTIAIARIDSRTVELRKNWLDEAYQGRGIGYAMLSHMIQKAKAMGYEEMTLETCWRLKRANSLYRGVGFEMGPELPHHPETDFGMRLSLK